MIFIEAFYVGAKWAASKIMLKIFIKFENSKKQRKIWIIVKFLFAIITDVF